MELFGNTIRAATANTPVSTPVEDDYATKIDDFFALRYREDVTLSDLAAALFISERQVSRILQSNYGMSFKNKLVEMRINAAKEPVSYTHLDVYKRQDPRTAHPPGGRRWRCRPTWSPAVWLQW